MNEKRYTIILSLPNGTHDSSKKVIGVRCRGCGRRVPKKELIIIGGKEYCSSCVCD
jgi:formylmethanofuran dehydrogenase subunit E